MRKFGRFWAFWEMRNRVWPNWMSRMNWCVCRVGIRKRQWIIHWELPIGLIRDMHWGGDTIGGILRCLDSVEDTPFVCMHWQWEWLIRGICEDVWRILADATNDRCNKIVAMITCGCWKQEFSIEVWTGTFFAPFVATDTVHVQLWDGCFLRQMHGYGILIHHLLLVIRNQHEYWISDSYFLVFTIAILLHHKQFDTTRFHTWSRYKMINASLSSDREGEAQKQETSSAVKSHINRVFFHARFVRVLGWEMFLCVGKIDLTPRSYIVWCQFWRASCVYLVLWASLFLKILITSVGAK